MRPKTMETDIQKLYYSMGEVAERLEVKASCIRYWDNALNLNLRIDKKGNRYCTVHDLEVLSQVKILRFEKKFTVAGTLQELKLRGLVR
jgi:DNA-binding transcriptional MerR regulator